MACGPGWQDCPFFVRAMAEPGAIANFTLPPAAHPALRVIVDGLEDLEAHVVRHWVAEVEGCSDTDLLELSRLVVTLCESPEDLTNVSYAVAETHWTAEPTLARYIVTVLKEGSVNSTKGTYGGVVNLVANSLAMDTADVQACPRDMGHMVQCLAEGAPPCSLVLYGNVVPYAVEHGQVHNSAATALLNKELDQLLASLDGLLAEGQQPSTAAAGSTTRSIPQRTARRGRIIPLYSRWARLELLQQSKIVAQTDTDDC